MAAPALGGSGSDRPLFVSDASVEAWSSFPFLGERAGEGQPPCTLHPAIHHDLPHSRSWRPALLPKSMYSDRVRLVFVLLVLYGSVDSRLARRNTRDFLLTLFALSKQSRAPPDICKPMRQHAADTSVNRW